ncbi:MAG TPA: oligosaccharide flippase family protein, partial [Savagea sp.]
MQQNIQMKQIMKGATILTIAAFIVKVLSAIYRVPFQNLVGDRGFYIYQQIYPFIGMTTVWISYGLSVALSKMLVEAQTQKEYDSVKKIVGVTLFLLTVVLFLFFQFSGEHLAKWMGDSALAPLLQALSFMMLFVAPLTLFKGEKQAMGDLTTVAISNIL